MADGCPVRAARSDLLELELEQTTLIIIALSRQVRRGRAAKKYVGIISDISDIILSLLTSLRLLTPTQQLARGDFFVYISLLLAIIPKLAEKGSQFIGQGLVNYLIFH